MQIMSYTKQDAARVRDWLRKQLQYIVRYGTTRGEVAVALELSAQLDIPLKRSRAKYHNRFSRRSRTADAA